MARENGLLPRQARFVEEYLVDLNGGAAAQRAGYTPKSARQTACDLLRMPDIQDAIATAQAARSVRVQISQDDVLRRIRDAINANPNDLVEFRRICCRHCYGLDHRYQYTPGEADAARADLEERKRVARERKKPLRGPAARFDEKGGTGYDKRQPPAPDCPECFGEGVGEVFIKDTRNLTPEQRALYASIRQSKEGIEVKTHDPIAFMTLGMRHLGMLNDKLEHSGPGGSALAPPVFNVTFGDTEDGGG